MWLSWANNNMPSHFLKKTSIPTHQGVVWMEEGVERKGEIGFNEVLMFYFILFFFLKGERTTWQN